MLELVQQDGEWQELERDRQSSVHWHVLEPWEDTRHCREVQHWDEWCLRDKAQDTEQVQDYTCEWVQHNWCSRHTCSLMHIKLAFEKYID